MIVQRPSIDLEQDPTFLPEIWAWYAVGVIVVFLRYLVRIRTVGFRGFRGDDFITVMSLTLYTMDAVLVHIVYHTGANVDVPPNLVERLSQRDVEILSYGSKCELAAWYSYSGLIWCMKFTMLFFYKRFTMGTSQERIVNWMFWFCGATYFAVFCTITFSCRPISENWQVRPPPSKACSFKPQNFYVTVVLNVITDAIIMWIPMPLLYHLKVSLSRKLGVAALLSSGLFVITAAIIRAVLTLGSKPSALNINRWGVRETITGLITVTVPILRPLFTRAFWRKGPYRKESKWAQGMSGWSSSRSRSTRSKGTFGLRYAKGSIRLKERDSNEIVGRIGLDGLSAEDILGRGGGAKVMAGAVGTGVGAGEGLELGELDVVDGAVVVRQTYGITSHPRDEERALGEGSVSGVEGGNNRGKGLDEVWAGGSEVGFDTTVTTESGSGR